MERKRKSKIDGRSFFDVISEKFFFLLKNGIFGRFFTSYDEVNEKYLQSVKRKKKTVGHSKVRKSMSKTIQNSLLVNAMPRFVEWLLRVSTRDYGIMMLVMGAVIALLYPLNGYVLFLNVTFRMFISALAVCVLSIPLLCSGKSISKNIYNSKLCNALFFKLLGLNKEKMRQVSEKQRVSLPNAAFFVGVLLGVLSYFVMPLELIGGIALIVLAYCVLTRPEIGVLVTVTILPFASTRVLIFCVGYVFVCYALKCILGRRTFKFEYFDVFVVILLIITLIRGAISTNIVESIPSALSTVCLMSFYFILTNLIRTKEWFRRCLVSLVLSGMAVAIIGIIQVIIGKLSVRVPDLLKLFSNEQSATGPFNDPNTFAHYLAAIIPFTIVHFISERSGRKKLSGVFFGIIMVIALCLAHSLSGIIGIVFATLLLLIIFNRNFSYLALAFCVLCPVLYFTLPQNALDSILSIKILEGVSITGIVNETREGFAMVLEKPFGIGSGVEVFKSAFQTSEGYFDNAIIQALLEYGVIGFVAILLFGIMLMRLTFSYCLKAKNQYRKINCCVGFCAVAGLVVSSVINYTWYDKRIFLMFWILVAISFAYMRIERADEEPEGLVDDYTTAVLDVILTEEAYRDETHSRKYVRLPKKVDNKIKKHHIDEKNDTERDEFENSDEYQIVDHKIENPLKIESVNIYQSEIMDTSVAKIIENKQLGNTKITQNANSNDSKDDKE